MSFLFKTKPQKGPASNALPYASREVRSSDGPASQIPTFNTALSGSKPSSPTTATYANGMHPTNPGERAMSGAGAGPRHPLAAQYAEENGPRQTISPSPEQKTLREHGNQANDFSNAPRNALAQSRQHPLSDSSPYPWSQRRLNFTLSNVNPFPRYGAAVNASSGKDGSIYIMGGLINGSTVKGDLWMLEAGNGSLSCYQVATTSEGPGPRVGHASLLVGNAFIVFGGDTKMDEGDLLDDTLYLLNTSTKQWSRALPAGPRPPGRYGHTLNILGSKIYIFGGQVEGYFFNDLVAFDLNALQQTSNRWELLIQNTIDSGPPHGQIPPARTNHTMVSWGDKLYLFGGTDGVQWFNDVWAYTPQTNSWALLECIGYIPSPREGHAAALVGDVMYIFGGRDEDGTDLGDLAAFRITSRRWYTFQNMGPSPSPRSGHSMTTVGKSIVVLAGEPSSAPRDPIELAQAYFLDTTKIRYPPDTAPQTSANNRISSARRPSGESNTAPGQPRGPPKELDTQRSDSRLRGDSNGSRLPRAAGSPGQPLSPAPTGPPPQAPLQNRQNGPTVSRQTSAPTERPVNQPGEQRPDAASASVRPLVTRDAPRGVTSPSYDEPQRFKPETYQPSDPSAESVRRSLSQQAHPNPVTDERNETTGTYMESTEQQPRGQAGRLSHEAEGPQDSGIGSSPAFSQPTDTLLRELDKLKQRNAWYASELALARKSGYQTRDTDSPVLDERAADTLGDEDKPLIEALLKMRAELTRVQDVIDEQSKRAAARIAEVEKQRDTAVSEAVFAKAKLAGQGSPYMGDEGKAGLTGAAEASDRSNDMNRRLASSLAAQSELSRRVGALVQDVETEKAARQVAQDTADATQKRISELEQHRQQYSAELEGLRAALHEAQREARELSANYAEVSSQHRLLTIDKSELETRLQNATASTEDHSTVLGGLRSAVTASGEKAELLSRQLEEERRERDALQQELQVLRAEHEKSHASLQTTTRRLRDAEDLAAKHADEARAHREAVLVGLDKLPMHDGSSGLVSDERIAVLQEQAEAANALARQNQVAADTAAEKLRSAEERIAGLEAYQEQASRESLSIRKQLQNAIKDNQAAHLEKNELEQRFQSQVLETNALKVQHSSLKDILGERGVNASEVRRSRAIDSPSSLSKRFSTPDLQRVKELEQQLEVTIKSHEEMKAQFVDVSERDEKMKREYEEKLTALDNDHQAAVKYLRGTEKMLSKMKQELQRVKNENGELKKRLDKTRIDSREASPMIGSSSDWEQEREKLQKEVEVVQTNHKSAISGMENRIKEIEMQLQGSAHELEQARSEHADVKSSLTTLQATHAQTVAGINRLQQENSALEERARDAERKVQLLLDQVEHSVDNYRRQSRMATDGQATTMNGVLHSRNLSADVGTTSAAQAFGHSRNVSDGGNSVYSISGADDAGDGRNSLALDSLASELDALRTHWETTNKNYRLSDKFDFERAPDTEAHSGAGAFGGSLASWRHDLDTSDDGSRPGTSEGTVKGNSPRPSAMPEATSSTLDAGLHLRSSPTTTTTTAPSAAGPGGATMI